MDIKILHLVEGAKKVIPIGDADVAYKLKAENPEIVHTNGLFRFCFAFEQR